MGIDRTYKLYVFDLDGTLADTKKDIGRALQRVVESAGFEKPGEEEVVSAIGRGAKKAIQKLTGLEENVLDPYVEEFKKEYDAICCDNVTLYEGARELLARLKGQGAKLALVTMKFRSAADKIIKAKNIDLFDDVIAFDDVQKRKPDPESFLALLEKHSLSAGDALMVGDSITDLKYAKAAGADICIMEYGYGDMAEVAKQNPTYVLKSFYDF